MTTTPDVYLLRQAETDAELQGDHLAREEGLSLVVVGVALFAGQGPAGFTFHEAHNVLEAVAEGGGAGVEDGAVVGEDVQPLVVLVVTRLVVVDFHVGVIGDAFEEEITLAGVGDQFLQLAGAVGDDGDLLDFGELVQGRADVDGVGFLGVGVSGRHDF